MISMDANGPPEQREALAEWGFNHRTSFFASECPCRAFEKGLSKQIPPFNFKYSDSMTPGLTNGTSSNA